MGEPVPKPATDGQASSAPLEASRARRERSPREVTDERVLEIAALMAAGQWVRGDSDAAKGAEWDLEPVTVAHLAAQASRLARLLQRDHARARLAKALDTGLGLAERELEAAEGTGRCPVCKRADIDILGKLPAVADRYAKLTGADEARPDTTVVVAVQVVASIRALPGPERFEALRELATLALDELPPARRERARALLAQAFVADDATPEEAP